METSEQSPEALVSGESVGSGSSSEAGAAPAPPDEAGAAEGGWRVKLYELTEDGSWKDMGTVFASAEQKTIDAPKPANVEGAAEPSASEEPTVLPMVVLREQQERSSNVFTEIPVSEFFIYRRQQVTIIVVERPGSGLRDSALSFQENTGCNAIWKFIVASLNCPPDCDVAPHRGLLLGAGSGGGSATAAADVSGTGSDMDVEASGSSSGSELDDDDEGGKDDDAASTGSSTSSSSLSSGSSDDDEDVTLPTTTRAAGPTGTGSGTDDATSAAAAALLGMPGSSKDGSSNSASTGSSRKRQREGGAEGGPSGPESVRQRTAGCEGGGTRIVPGASLLPSMSSSSTSSAIGVLAATEEMGFSPSQLDADYPAHHASSDVSSELEGQAEDAIMGHAAAGSLDDEDSQAPFVGPPAPSNSSSSWPGHDDGSDADGYGIFTAASLGLTPGSGALLQRTNNTPSNPLLSGNSGSSKPANSGGKLGALSGVTLDDLAELHSGDNGDDNDYGWGYGGHGGGRISSGGGHNGSDVYASPSSADDEEGSLGSSVAAGASASTGATTSITGGGGGLKESLLDAAQKHQAKILGLPNEPDITNITTVLASIRKWGRGDRHDALVSFLVNKKCAYLRRLMEVFDEAEDLEDNDTLTLFYEIAVELFRVNDTLLFEAFAADEIFEKIVGCFEWSPHERDHPRRHRAFLRHKARFRSVVNLEDNPELVSRIHQTFRFSYMKDALLPRNFDEGVLGSLNSAVYFNQGEILLDCVRKKKLLDDVFALIRAPTSAGNALDRYNTYANRNAAIAAAEAEKLARREARRAARKAARQAAAAALTAGSDSGAVDASMLTSGAASTALTSDDGPLSPTQPSAEPAGGSSYLQPTSQQEMLDDENNSSDSAVATSTSSPTSSSAPQAAQQTSSNSDNDSSISSEAVSASSTTTATTSIAVDSTESTNSRNSSASSSDVTMGEAAESAASSVSGGPSTPSKAAATTSATIPPEGAPPHISPLSDSCISSHFQPPNAASDSAAAASAGSVDSLPLSGDSSGSGSTQLLSPGSSTTAIAATALADISMLAGDHSGGTNDGSASQGMLLTSVLEDDDAMAAVEVGSPTRRSSAGTAATVIARKKDGITVDGDSDDYSSDAETIVQEGSGDGTTALMPLSLDEVDTPESPRESALLFLTELIQLAKPQQANNKSMFFRTLLERPLFASLEPVLADRHATVKEVSAALEVISTLVNQQDPVYLSDFRSFCDRQRKHPDTAPTAAQRPITEFKPYSPLPAVAPSSAVVSASSPSSPSASSSFPLLPAAAASSLAAAVAPSPATGAPLNGGSGVSTSPAASPSAVAIVPPRQTSDASNISTVSATTPTAGSAPAPWPPQQQASSGAARILTSDEVLALVRTRAYDDGVSIRLYEKLHTLALSGELVGLISCPEDLTRFNETRLPYGEHGRLVVFTGKECAGRPVTMLHRLVWRAVDDPEPAIQHACVSLLRALADTDSAQMPQETLLTQLYDWYLPWLLQPFLHPALPMFSIAQPPPTNNAPSAASSATNAIAAAAGIVLPPPPSAADSSSSSSAASQQLAKPKVAPCFDLGMEALKAALDRKAARIAAASPSGAAAAVAAPPAASPPAARGRGKGKGPMMRAGLPPLTSPAGTTASLTSSLKSSADATVPPDAAWGLLFPQAVASTAVATSASASPAAPSPSVCAAVVAPVCSTAAAAAPPTPSSGGRSSSNSPPLLPPPIEPSYYIPPKEAPAAAKKDACLIAGLFAAGRCPDILGMCRDTAGSAPAPPSTGGTGWRLADPADLRHMVVPALAPGFSGGVASAVVGGESSLSKASKLGLIETVCLFMPQHTLRMRYLVVRMRLMNRLQRLFRYPERHMVLQGVKLLRCCIAQRESFYVKHMTSEQLLAPLAAATVLQGGGTGLLNSAVLELLHSIAEAADPSATPSSNGGSLGGLGGSLWRHGSSHGLGLGGGAGGAEACAKEAKELAKLLTTKGAPFLTLLDYAPLRKALENVAAGRALSDGMSVRSDNGSVTEEHTSDSGGDDQKGWFAPNGKYIIPLGSGYGSGGSGYGMGGALLGFGLGSAKGRSQGGGVGAAGSAALLASDDDDGGEEGEEDEALMNYWDEDEEGDDDGSGGILGGAYSTSNSRSVSAGIVSGLGMGKGLLKAALTKPPTVLATNAAAMAAAGGNGTTAAAGAAAGTVKAGNGGLGKGLALLNRGVGAGSAAAVPKNIVVQPGPAKPSPSGAATGQKRPRSASSDAFEFDDDDEETDAAEGPTATSFSGGIVPYEDESIATATAPNASVSAPSLSSPSFTPVPAATVEVVDDSSPSAAADLIRASIAATAMEVEEAPAPNAAPAAPMFSGSAPSAVNTAAPAATATPSAAAAAAAAAAKLAKTDDDDGFMDRATFISRSRSGSDVSSGSSSSSTGGATGGLQRVKIMEDEDDEDEGRLGPAITLPRPSLAFPPLPVPPPQLNVPGLAPLPANSSSSSSSSSPRIGGPLIGRMQLPSPRGGNGSGSSGAQPSLGPVRFTPRVVLSGPVKPMTSSSLLSGGPVAPRPSGLLALNQRAPHPSVPIITNSTSITSSAAPPSASSADSTPSSAGGGFMPVEEEEDVEPPTDANPRNAMSSQQWLETEAPVTSTVGAGTETAAAAVSDSTSAAAAAASEQLAPAAAAASEAPRWPL